MPPNTNNIKQCVFAPSEVSLIDLEIHKLLKKGVIFESPRCAGDFLSSIFTRPKKDGTRRMILNLSDLNEYVGYQHFKMESLHDVQNIIKPNVWMASVDLKDAFYSIPVNKNHQKYFKFFWKDKFYEFQGMPNGYGPAMRLFTKVLKPPFACLRAKGHMSVVYVDDTYLQGNTQQECLDNAIATVSLLRKLGFTIHLEKSQLLPVQELEFLGFLINSKNMTIKLTDNKIHGIREKILKFLNMKKPTIKDLASVIGTVISTFPAIPYGKLHYRNSEKCKIEALKINKGNFKATILINPSIKLELQWWLDNIANTFNNLHLPDVDIVIYTDASELGWGATDGVNPTGGQWLPAEIQHINCLELQAAYFAIKSYCRNKIFKHIRIMTDNQTTVAYINHMGGTKSATCNNIAITIWNFCIQQNCWISAAHVPGVDNTIADNKSRKFHDNTEWQLLPKHFDTITNSLNFMPTVDLFASRVNHQLNRYVSWHPDPNAIVTDAFTISWTDIKFYAFPPFSIIGDTVAKIIKDGASGIIIIPKWNTQCWFPNVMRITKQMIPIPKKALRLPSKPQETHPLEKNLSLIALLVSAQP
eukprot:gene10499-11598_t